MVDAERFDCDDDMARFRLRDAPEKLLLSPIRRSGLICNRDFRLIRAREGLLVRIEAKSRGRSEIIMELVRTVGLSTVSDEAQDGSHRMRELGAQDKVQNRRTALP
jgi:hypothetical protein